MPEELGVVGPTPDVTRLLRAVKGVGALISDFFGVSVILLLARLLVKLVEEDNIDLEEEGGGGLAILGRFPAVTYG